MLHLQSTAKEIDNYIEQISLLINNDKENNKIKKILELKSLIQDPDITTMISGDLKDETWIQDTQILIDTCIKRTTKSNTLLHHVTECKNFFVFRQIEEKLNSNQLLKIQKNDDWTFILVKNNGNETPWNMPKFLKSFNASIFPEKIQALLDEENSFNLTKDWLYKNQKDFFSKKIFETEK